MITDITSLNKDSSLITTHESGLYILTADKLLPFKLSGMAAILINIFQALSKLMMRIS
jgi:hypothetical protein